MVRRHGEATTHYDADSAGDLGWRPRSDDADATVAQRDRVAWNAGVAVSQRRAAAPPTGNSWPGDGA